MDRICSVWVIALSQLRLYLDSKTSTKINTMNNKCFYYNNKQIYIFKITCIYILTYCRRYKLFALLCIHFFYIE